MCLKINLSIYFEKAVLKYLCLPGVMATQESHNLSLPVRFWGRATGFHLFVGFARCFVDATFFGPGLTLCVALDVTIDRDETRGCRLSIQITTKSIQPSTYYLPAAGGSVVYRRSNSVLIPS